MDVTVNGRAEQVEPGTTVAGYLAARGLDPAHVVVEINRDIAGRDTFTARELQTGDRVEILRFVGGG